MTKTSCWLPGGRFPLQWRQSWDIDLARNDLIRFCSRWDCFLPPLAPPLDHTTGNFALAVFWVLAAPIDTYNNEKELHRTWCGLAMYWQGKTDTLLSLSRCCKQLASQRRRLKVQGDKQPSARQHTRCVTQPFCRQSGVWMCMFLCVWLWLLVHRTAPSAAACSYEQNCLWNYFISKTSTFVKKLFLKFVHFQNSYFCDTVSLSLKSYCINTPLSKYLTNAVVHIASASVIVV